MQYLENKARLIFLIMAATLLLKDPSTWETKTNWNPIVDSYTSMYRVALILWAVNSVTTLPG